MTAVVNKISDLNRVSIHTVFLFSLKTRFRQVSDAMRSVFGAGSTTADLRDPAGELTIIKTSEFGDKVVAALKA